MTMTPYMSATFSLMNLSTDSSGHPWGEPFASAGMRKDTGAPEDCGQGQLAG